MKKSLLFIGMFVLTLVFSSFVFSCDSSQVIFSLYSENNSHIGSFDNLNYNVKACYSLFSQSEYLGENSRVCEGKDVIFYKASEENSHVSLTQSDVYNFPVCYGDLVCENRTNCLDGEEVLARISSATNAHLSLGDSDSNYPIKICCKKGSPDYISSVSLAKWIDSFSGEEVSEVSNGTKVNISFEGEFQEGELFNYRIYVKKDNLFGIVQSNVLIYSGSGVIETADSFSSIYFDAIWNESFLIEGKSVYIFKIFGKDGTELKRSEELLVNKTGGLNPTITKISSPKDGEIYFEGDKINLNWSLVSGDKIVNNLTYYSPGANINGTGRDVFSILGSHDDLINLPLYLNYSTSGQKEIILTTVDSTGRSHTSRVLITVPEEGINIFAYIHQPEDRSTVTVCDEYNNVLFNSSKSYVYNYSSLGILSCLVGRCPATTSGDNSKTISSSLSEDLKNLKSEKLYFNWSWQHESITFFGNGTSPNIVSPKKVSSPGSEIVFLNLNYSGEIQSTSNQYIVNYNGAFCSLDYSSFGVYTLGSFTSEGTCSKEGFDDCCKEGYECINGDCELISNSKILCAQFNSSKAECESKSPAKGPIANRSLEYCGLKTSLGGTKYSIWENCTCVWDAENSTCFAHADSNTYGLDNPNSDIPQGSCSVVTSGVTGSCNDRESLTVSSIASWIWTSVNKDPNYPDKLKCDNLNKENLIPCPVRLKLSFFGIMEFVVSIILVALIYFVIRDLFKRKKDFSLEEKKTSKKKITKKKAKK